MYPGHVAPNEALVEIAAASKAPKPPTRRDPPTERPPKKPDSSGTTANEELADDHYDRAMKAFIGGDYKSAISKARGAIDNGCRNKCYRVVGMSHYMRKDSKKACSWLAKAASEIPKDLECP